MTNFGRKLIAGKSIGAQPDLAAKINKICDVLDNLDGGGQFKIVRNGVYWHISGSGSTIPVLQSFGVVSIVDSTVTIGNLGYRRYPITVIQGGTKTFVLSGISCLLCASVDLNTGTIDLGSEYDTQMPTDQSKVRFPLYNFARASTTGKWQIQSDYRNLPDIAVYI